MVRRKAREHIIGWEERGIIEWKRNRKRDKASLQRWAGRFDLLFAAVGGVFEYFRFWVIGLGRFM